MVAPGLCCWRYAAIRLMRSYGPGGHRYGLGGIVSATRPPDGSSASRARSSAVSGPGLQAAGNRLAAASFQPSIPRVVERHARTQDQAVSCHHAVGGDDGLRVDVDRLHFGVKDPDAVSLRECGVGMGDLVNRPKMTDHPIADRARVERGPSFDQDHLDAGIQQPNVLGGRETAPAAAENHHAGAGRRQDAFGANGQGRNQCSGAARQNASAGETHGSFPGGCAANHSASAAISESS